MHDILMECNNGRECMPTWMSREINQELELKAFQMQRYQNQLASGIFPYRCFPIKFCTYKINKMPLKHSKHTK
jgi:hypothetical protein